MKKVFAIFDKASQTYGNPFVAINTAVATRDFWQACKEPKSPMALFPRDIELHLIGEYNEETGLLSPNKQIVLSNDGAEKEEYVAPMPLAKAIDFIKMSNSNQEQKDGQANVGPNHNNNN